jgi:hypothetical protein
MLTAYMVNVDAVSVASKLAWNYVKHNEENDTFKVILGYICTRATLSHNAFLMQ